MEWLQDEPHDDEGIDVEAGDALLVEQLAGLDHDAYSKLMSTLKRFSEALRLQVKLFTVRGQKVHREAEFAIPSKRHSSVG